MENHPIPQDITGFQFKLIGNMTVRQFIYLAVGAIIAVFFLFLVPIPFIVNLIIAIVSFGTGAAFAFIPIDGRPMDTMVGNLFKAMFSPTKYIYQKTGGDLSKSPGVPSESQAQIAPFPIQASSPTPPPPMPDLQATQPVPAPPPLNLQASPQAPTSSAPQSPEFEKMLKEIQEQKEGLEKELLALKAQLENQKSEAIPKEAPIPQQAPPAQAPTEQLSVAPRAEPVLLNIPPSPPSPNQTGTGSPVAPQQNIPVSSQEAPLPAQSVTPPPQPAEPQQPTPPPQPAPPAPTPPPSPPDPAVDLPIPEAPNLITGIIRDPRGNPLQNILVEVKDQDDNPVRAFKTNGLGRFASATSLANGKYILIFEDPKGANKFDPIQIEAIGNPIVPLAISSVDAREELRRSLFN